MSHPLVAVFGAALLTIPWLGLHTVFGADLQTGVTVALSGIAVLGASFLLAWGAETAEADVPRAFALAILAVLAVAPEYAVDALYAWEAGINPGSPESAEAASLAVANMTGANRILIGIGWSAIALFTVVRARKTGDEAVESRPGFLADVVRLDRGISTEILFLFLATMFAFFVPLGAGIGAFDMFVLVGLYVVYILAALNAPHEHEEQIGVPAYLQSYPRMKRIATTLTLFIFSGIVILVAVEPFAHGLEELGTSVGIPPFLMIQWVAPLASESPELIVVAYLVNKARSTAGFNALISSKLNQWTLLIGTLVLVYSLSLGSYGPLPLDNHQAGELWLTAAQSYFAIAILITFSISVREALALLGLFFAQFIYSVTGMALTLPIPGLGAVTFDGATSLIGFSVIYLVVGTALFVARRKELMAVARLSIRRVRGDYTTGETTVAAED
ncbi:Na+/Ca2+-exchanging protein [Haloferax mediterranei ATCC 33500]|uniref:Na+/Ca2+-exchanging protein n=1 Tax=Haloferax mediterranei (strain ATCC 33500 / DSM 1411 / JCM 8866 / NBRC 14739 / NCIMB 2177 / R-4) TaxID=523841 RepID=M0J1U6_HALMT|nr:Na+/Ca2+-exchanging protein [Haloferax mediterranei ATCC 33500]